MSEQLQKVALDEALLSNPLVAAQVAAFECGSEPWELEVAEWLKRPKGGEGAIDAALAEGTFVLLYWTPVRELAGYGCVGPGTLKWPNPNKSQPILTTAIPMLGVAKAMQRKGYGKQILDDLLAFALTRVAERRIVVLSVHEKNPGAKLYEKRNFKPFGKPRPLPPNGDLYQRYVLDLGEPPAPAPAA